ncbi:LysM domain-containing protein [Colletotrichum truncatum]|uniref:LysM domain-containing protein n=1 Tax=Colletotrichum truncatum TaxID=5467 RepID=A0ACC3YUT6_COLTU|nr:LysM domain-containing protein [Colletotrichum truncatum]KAF6785878.1 LysM domain-containing protein [Colletotrichum truncatum]
MVFTFVQKLAVAAAAAQFLGLPSLASAAALRLHARAGDEPGLPHDPNTTSYCSWWIDYDGSQTCQEVLEWNWIEISDFRRWNPTVDENCNGLTAGNSYCVEAWTEPKPPAEPSTTAAASTTVRVTTTSAPPTTTQPPSTTTKPVTTTTITGNGVETPLPVHNGIVKNCAKFHLVQVGDTCAVIARNYGLTTADVVSWNGLNNGCTDLWGDTYACVGLIGGTQTTAAPSTTAAGNGVETPAPVHNGIVKNCAKFHLVQIGDTCAVIARNYGISVAQVVSWNGLNNGCTDLWGDTYACVGLVGGTQTSITPATTTTAGNGVQTPAPVHNGIVNNCAKFHFVQSGDTCAVIARNYGVSVSQVVSWNGLNNGCTDLWGDTYACVGLIGGTQTSIAPVTTTAGNGVQTPAPVHNGIVKNCAKFHLVQSGDTCAVIARNYGLSTSQVVSWNGLNNGCTDLWGDTYACVGLIGGTPTTTAKTTTTAAGNGVQTPQPTQPGIASNCNKFHLVKSGDTCASIASGNNIPVSRFIQWNSLNSACSNLWGDTYACIGLIGSSPSPTTTKPPTGVTTPQPIQGSIVPNCRKFEWINGGDTCEVVANRNGITVKQLTTWNPSIGSDCRSLWANAYACVSGP